MTNTVVRIRPTGFDHVVSVGSGEAIPDRPAAFDALADFFTTHW